MGQKFVYKVGEENQPQIVDLNSDYLEDAFFSEQFKKSLRVVDSHLRHLSSIEGGGEYINNILAFIGERGTGKTSCMLSVSKILCEGSVPKEKYERLEKAKFEKLEMIDPTYLDGDKKSIVGAVVAQLYRNYCDTRDAHNSPAFNSGHFTKERELLSQFDKVQRDIRCLLENKMLNDDDDLEQLGNLAATINLRDNIRELIKLYMDFLDKSDHLLLIPIDDIDLQSEGATAMVEQIRKYLNHPSVLVLLALKMEQLQNLEQQKFLKEYKELISAHSMSVDATEVMADHYLVKLIPHNQRILMPDSSDYLVQRLKIIFEDQSVEEFDSFQEAVPMLIFRKTRFLFYNINKEPSYVIPTNLRQLLQLLKMLVSMQDYYEWIGSKFNPKGDASNLYNKELFKNYFFESWTRSYLSNECRNDILKLYKIPSALQFNSEVLQVLQKHFGHFFEQYSNNSQNTIIKTVYKEVLSITRPNNVVYNLSMGDIIGILDILERQSRDTQKLRFIFAIRSLYSMKLYAYYDEETDICRRKFINDGIRSLRRYDILNNYDLSNYDKLVGGNFINVHLNELMPESHIGGSLSWRIINMRSLNDLIELCNKMSSKDAQNNKSLFRLAEFFMLTVSRDYLIIESKKHMNIEQPYRILKEPFYAKQISRNCKYAVFDIASFMFNITRMEKCYGRFTIAKDFYKKVDSPEFESVSLLGEFKRMSIEKDKDRFVREKSHYNTWLSWASIRNAEVMQDFLNYFEGQVYSGKDDFEYFADFFKKLNRYSIKTYDKFGKDTAVVYPYQNFFDIHFNFSNILVRLFSQMSNDAKGWFMRIFYLGYA